MTSTSDTRTRSASTGAASSPMPAGVVHPLVRPHTDAVSGDTGDDLGGMHPRMPWHRGMHTRWAWTHVPLLALAFCVLAWIAIVLGVLSLAGRSTPPGGAEKAGGGRQESAGESSRPHPEMRTNGKRESP
jgi:hypothetical protein